MSTMGTCVGQQGELSLGCGRCVGRGRGAAALGHTHAVLRVATRASSHPGTPERLPGTQLPVEKAEAQRRAGGVGQSNFERTLWSWPLCPQTHSLPFLCPPSSAVTSVAHSPEAPVQSSAPVAWPSLELYALNLVTAFCCRSHSLEGNEFQLTPAEFHRA